MVVVVVWGGGGGSHRGHYSSITNSATFKFVACLCVLRHSRPVYSGDCHLNTQGSDHILLGPPAVHSSLGSS